MKSPVFIIGCPRSGTTLLLNILATHEDFAWVSSFGDLLPRFPIINMLNRIYDFPIMGEKLYLLKEDIRLLPRPAEPWIFWNRLLVNFRWKKDIRHSVPRRITENDISPGEIQRAKKAVNQILKIHGKEFFLSKYTDYPRIRFLRTAFPEAKFIHIRRDGRAATWSYIKQIRKGIFKTWEERDWWIQVWEESWRDEWLDKYFGSQAGFVAYQWRLFLKEIKEDARILEENSFIEIRYEDLTRNPKKTIREITDFCGLPFSNRIKNHINNISMRNMNYKWEEEATEEEKQIIEEIVFAA